MDNSIVDQLLPALQQQIGAHLLGAYIVQPTGDGYFLRDRFEPALLLLLHEDFPIHAAREAILKLRINWRHVLEASPYVFTPASLSRHVRLFPLFHQHLSRHSERIHGQILPLESPGRVHRIELLAFLITEAIETSAALVPDQSDLHMLNRLQRLARHMSNHNGSAQATPAELFAQVQIHLRLILDSLPALAPHRVPAAKSGEPNLLAFYEDRQNLLAVIPQLSGKLLQKIDWPALAHARNEQTTALNVATSDQFFLSIQAQRPLDYVLGNFRRLWGVDLLKNLSVSARGVYRQAARRPSSWLVAGVLGDYLLAPNAKALHQVIHDYQNRLLNLRLQHELLSRIFSIAPQEPPVPLPRRDEPLAVRIDAITAHLDWWANHYTQSMESRQADEKMAPP